MKKILTGAAAALAFTLATAPAANAAASLDSWDISGVDRTGTLDLNAVFVPGQGILRTGSADGIYREPTGNVAGETYWAVGPGNAGTPAYLDFSSFGEVALISFIWGSVDTWNTLRIIGKDSTELLTLTGSQILALTGGPGSTAAAADNPFITLRFTGADRFNVGHFEVSSSQNAGEFAAFSLGVPEPSTWALMILGFGLIGSALRRRQRVQAKINFA